MRNKTNLPIKQLQKIQDNFATALSLPILVRGEKGEILTRPTGFAKLSQLLRKSVHLETKYQQQLLEGFEKCDRTHNLTIFEPTPDTNSFISPIIHNGLILAYFVSDAVRMGNPNLHSAEKTAKELKIETEQYLDFLLTLPIFTAEKLQATANLLKLMGNIISSLEIEGEELKLSKAKTEAANLKLLNNLRKTMSELGESQFKYQSILATADAGVYIRNLDGEILDINPLGARLLGFEQSEDIIGKNIINLYQRSSEFENFNKLLMQNGQIKKWIAELITPSGEHRFIEMNSNLVNDTGKQSVYIQTIFKDISEKFLINYA